MMDCAAFENRLTGLLAGEVDPASKQAVLDELKRHAGRCAGCGAAAALIEIAALPPHERDPVEAPEGYWDGFNAAVARRVGREPAARPARARRRFAVAAAVAAALVSGWLLRGWLDPGPPQQAAAVEPGPASAEWGELEEVIRQATPEQLAEALRGLPGGGWSGLEASAWALDGAGVGGGWVPDAEALEDYDPSELLEWLDQLDRIEGRPTS